MDKIPAGYRELTHEEIRTLLDQLDTRENWRDLRAIVQPYYGERVSLVKITTEAESDDEGGSYDHISSIAIMDPEEQQIELDPALPWLQKELERETERWEYTWLVLRRRILACQRDEVPFPEDLIEELNTYILEQVEDKIRDTLPAIGKTYDLCTEPVVSWSQVLVPIEPGQK